MINFDFVYDNGKIKSPTPGIIKSKYRGWATKLNVDYPWDKFNFGAGILYATGDDKDKAGGKWRQEIQRLCPAPGSEGMGGTGEAIVFYGARTCYPLEVLVLPVSQRAHLLTLAMAEPGGLKSMLRPKSHLTYKVHAKLFYIGDTTKNGDTWGTRLDDKKFIGWEFDLYQFNPALQELKV